MAAGFGIFGETVRDWLEEPNNDEAELESLILAASDDYGYVVYRLTRPRPSVKCACATSQHCQPLPLAQSSSAL